MGFGRLALVVGMTIATVWASAQPDAVGAPPRPASAPPASRRVAAVSLPLRVEPSDQAYATGRLRRGAEVVVRRELDGWAEIDAPAGTFLWVDADGLRQRDDGPAVAIARRAGLRYATEGATEPGPAHPLGTLPGGIAVREVDQPPLVIEDGPRTRTWRAIEPPEPDSRFVRLDELEPLDDPEDRPPPKARPAPRGSDPTGDPATRPASFASDPDDLAGLPPGVVAELTAIAAEARAIQARPVESWDLEPIRGRYEALLRQFGQDSNVRAAIQRRQAAIERDAAASQAARDLNRLFREGDRIDAEVAEARRRLASARDRGDRAFDVVGLLQPSSRRYQGQKVHALIGPEGRPIGYVQIPPGVPANRYLAHRIGVRGVVRYDQGLGARLISARDLEILDKRR